MIIPNNREWECILPVDPTFGELKEQIFDDIVQALGIPKRIYLGQMKTIDPTIIARK